MVLWLWDVQGPAHFCGVTDSDIRAREAAEACVTGACTDTALVEKARLVLGMTLTSDYERTGNGWRLSRDCAGRISWLPFPEP
jgi:hypothetical protein